MSEILDWEEMTPAEKYALKMMCEQDFLTFHKAFFAMTQGEKWQVNWHHKYLAGVTERMVLGEMQGKSLIINVPPGAGKTEVFSIHAPVWGVVKTKKMRNLNVSFSDSLVKRNSIRSKDVIKSEPFQWMWPHVFTIDKDNEWKLVDKAGMPKAEVVSRSMGGQITGGRGGYSIPGFSGSVTLDDPDKPEDMFSKIKRNRLHRVIVDTLRSRRASKSKDNPTPFIIIQQRLHTEDTTGFILAGGMGKTFKYEHVVIPALINQEYIDSLPEWIRQDCIDSVCHTKQVNGYWSFWPDNEDVDDLIALWEANEYTFMSQYMQRPIRLGGELFKSDWWLYYGEMQRALNEEDVFRDLITNPDLPPPPSFEYRFITADTAQKTAEHNDFSVFCEWGYWDGRIYLIDMLRGKFEAPALRVAFKGFVMGAWSKNSKINGNLRSINVEDKSSGTGLIQDLSSELPIKIKAIQRNRDKLSRAYDTTPQIQAGKVVLPYGAPWIQEFVSEHSMFSIDDSHDHDDMVDNTMDAVDIALLNTSGSSTSALSMMNSLNKKRKR